jgi:hypothetical protein
MVIEMESTSTRRNVPATTALHPMVYAALVACTLWVVVAAWIFFAGSLYAGLQLAVAAFFAGMFLFTPFWLLRLSRSTSSRSLEFRDWADGDFETADGKIEARHAAAMVLIAPMAVAVGITAIGFVAWLAATGAI